MPRGIEIQHVPTTLDMVVDTWLGYTLPGAEQEIAASGWFVDQRDVYCPSCGEIVGRGEVVTAVGKAGKVRCGSCRGLRLPYRGFVRLGSYVGPLRQWVLAIKYRNWSEMAISLGDRLGRELVSSGAIDPARSVVVPMPMPWQRRLYRGMDHAGAIAAAVAKRIGAPVVRALVKRNGPPQVSLPTGKRRTNLRRRIRIRARLRSWDFSGMHVVLVDDVRTTGSSIREAAKGLRTLGPERIVVGVLAVTDGPTRRVDRTDVSQL